jgi:hypothetical protein
VQRDRLSWLGRIARLAGRFNVVIRTGVFGDDYRVLLRRAKIVFNRSVREECNQRVFEATGAGALLFQEEGNREVPEYFEPGREYVAYGDDNLETLLKHYLTHEEERQTIAAAARERVRGYSSESLWERTLATIESEWDDLTARAASRQKRDVTAEAIGRTWEGISAVAADPSIGKLPELNGGPSTAALHNAAGLAAALAGHGAAAAGQHLRAALGIDPRHPVAALNLIEVLAEMGAARPGRRWGQTAASPASSQRRVQARSTGRTPLPARFR